jgi:hypothetical protein
MRVIVYVEVSRIFVYGCSRLRICSLLHTQPYSTYVDSFHRLLASGMRLHPQSGPYAAPMVIYRYGELISFSNPLWIYILFIFLVSCLLYNYSLAAPSAGFRGILVMSGGEPSQSEKGLGDRGEIGDGRREESEDGDGDERVGIERRGGDALSDWI